MLVTKKMVEMMENIYYIGTSINCQQNGTPWTGYKLLLFHLFTILMLNV